MDLTEWPQLENYDEANIEELKAAQIKQQSLIATS